MEKYLPFKVQQQISENFKAALRENLDMLQR